MRLAIDANLTLLLVLGAHSTDLIERHKRLRPFKTRDFELLLRIVEPATSIVMTPNALTEVSNIAPFGLSESDKKAVASKLADLIPTWDERYVASQFAAKQNEFEWLGLSDCAWLCAIDADAHLLTVDHALHVAALKRGLQVTNFNHLRERYGTV